MVVVAHGAAIHGILSLTPFVANLLAAFQGPSQGQNDEEREADDAEVFPVVAAQQHAAAEIGHDGQIDNQEQCDNVVPFHCNAVIVIVS